MSATRILALCPDLERPFGGVRKLYHHVDVLNEHGLCAYIMHQKKGFRSTWFANETPIVYMDETPPGRNDCFVVPETYGPKATGFAPGIPKVIFNQNTYFTFRGYSADPADLRTPYTNPEVVAAFVVSEDNRQYLTYAFPDLPVFRLRLGIDHGLFARPVEKQPLIGFMPRKNAADAIQVINLLKHRGALAGFELVAIDKMPEAEVARTLGECLIFLSFGHPEGFSLPPLEAMACGCVVVGYHGRGGREYFQPEFCYPIEVGDVIGFAQTVERVLHAYRLSPEWVREKGRQACAYARENYTPEQETEDILSSWQSILSGE